MKRSHPMPFGAQLRPDGGTRFRLWAPTAKKVELIVMHDDAGRVIHSMTALDGGWYEGVDTLATAGTRYRYRIDGELEVPDPASRSNPDGVHAASAVVDPERFDWQDGQWRGRPWEEAVIYELHVGAFTPEGSFAAVIGRLDDLNELGVTAIELMPVSAFPGERGWGYDGVLPFAPYAGYGTPEDLKRLVQEAHARDLMVLLDVVYNHFGPDGNYLHRYAGTFFTDRHHTPWGAAINFDGPGSSPVRDFFIQNALYWLDEFHFDGLRLDAVHEIHDGGPKHFARELIETIDLHFGETGRQIHVVLENHHNAAGLLGGGGGARAQWNDDFHHAMHVLVTGEREGYYHDFGEQTISLLGRALAEGFSYQGEPSRVEQGARRGEPSRHLPPGSFIHFLQNHDQAGNRACGERLDQLADARRLRAALAIVLLAPPPPMLFMGEEYGAAQPFLYFCDFEGELGRAVTEGRRAEFAGFAAFSDAATRQDIPDPCDEETFARSLLRWEERGQPLHAERLAYVRGLLALRRKEIVPLLSTLAVGEATFEARHARGLEVTWPVRGGGALRLLANLGDAAQPIAGAAGTLLFSTGVDKAGGGDESFGPWEARWYRTG